MGRYTMIKIVGEGSFGRVWKALDNQSATSDIVAIKQIKKSCSSWEDCLELPEVKTLNQFKNTPNIVRLRNVIKEHDVLYLITQIIEGQDRPFFRAEIRGWSRQILQALTQMHRPGGYFHRDLKPDNLLVTKDGNIKIADFDQAQEIESQSPCSDYVTMRWYRAPEVLLKSFSYNSAVDMWAMGAIMAELYSFRPLFPGSNPEDQLYRICSVIGSPTLESWPEGVQLANACNIKFPRVPVVHAYGLSKMIPSASCEAIDLIKSLCSWDPKKRPTAMEALQHPFFAPKKQAAALPRPQIVSAL
ncbi:hypothetical protein MKW98_017894 [Papaver atlanticum]|uniref:Protein kinase domain-containing protein n=1 Tax=Papaver atlanticum TaxID=357466 RepID=A0AAD4TF62_9MAGN|nr:hypothetical protein MKW98_017894 [Papaver atlanticum]